MTTTSKSPKTPKTMMTSFGASIVLASLFIKAAAARKAEGRTAR